MKTQLTAIIFLLFLGMTINAESYDAHVHGAVNSQIILHETEGEIRFTLTGMDFVGFGYIAENEKDLNIVKDKVDQIMVSDIVKIKKSLFSKAEVHNISLELPEHASDDDHDDNAHASDDDHNDHDNAHASDSGHTDYEIIVSLEYDSIKVLKSLNITGFFEIFSSVEEVEWVLITDKGQNAGESTTNRPLIVIE